MPTTTLGTLPTSICSSAIGAVLAVLRSDPSLATSGVHVLAPEGNRNHLAPKVPEEGSLPAIRLRHDFTFRGGWGSEGSHFFDLVLPFDLIHLGRHYDDDGRLMEAFVRAIFPVDPSRAEAVDAMYHCNESLHILSTTVAVAGEQSENLGADQYARVFRASLIIKIEIDT